MKNLIKANREPSQVNSSGKNFSRKKKIKLKSRDFFSNDNYELIKRYQQWIELHDKWSMTDWVD